MKKRIIHVVCAIVLALGMGARGIAADACYDGYQADLVIADYFYAQCMQRAWIWFGGARECQGDRADAYQAARNLFYECRGYR